MQPYAAHIDELSRKSAEKHHDAYRELCEDLGPYRAPVWRRLGVAPSSQRNET